jgi:Cytochrome c
VRVFALHPPAFESSVDTARPSTARCALGAAARRSYAGLPRLRYADPVPVSYDQRAAVAGAALYVRYGCINCHGPNGLGGVPNPGSPDKTIPPLSGQEFRIEFNTDAKIIAVIRSVFPFTPEAVPCDDPRGEEREQCHGNC